jgi:hypothetical protein
MPPINAFDDYKKLTKEERDFYLFNAITGINEKINTLCLDVLDERYAKKVVETIIFNGIKLVLIAFVVALIGLVIIK